MIILTHIIHYTFFLYTLFLILRLVGSWFPKFTQYRAFFYLRAVTDPYLNLFRRFIPPIGGALDLSPILGFFCLELLEKFAFWGLKLIF